VKIRLATISDVESCGRITHEAFTELARRHGFPSDFPTLEYAVCSVNHQISHPSVFGIVAMIDSEVVGLGFLYERDPIRAVGGLAVSPRYEDQGIGYHLMKTLLKRSAGSLGIRLLTDTFNAKSISLYTSLGFEAKETCVVVVGRPKSKPPSRFQVRSLLANDLQNCEDLCKRVHGFERTNELREAIQFLSPLVAVQDGRICAYTTTMLRWHRAHGVAETEEDMEALILGAAATTADSLSFLLPMRQTRLFQFCLEEGLRIIKPMTLMSLGTYQEPRGCFFPSALY